MGITTEISTLEDMCDLMCDNKLPKEKEKEMNHGLKLHQDGTLEIILPKGKKVSKVLIGESGKQGVYYQYGELIRCEECKHYRSYAGMIDGCCRMAEWYNRYQYPDDYCSRAKRKE